jgi:hypothetical protein
LAQPLEEQAWSKVSAALLDPERLMQGLAAAEQQHAEADQRRQARLATIDREVERLRIKMNRITSERLDATPGSEAERALRTLAEETEVAIRRLLADRAELAAVPMPGLTVEEGLALTRFAEEVRAGLENATRSEQRRVFELMRLRGHVREDSEHGVKLGRRHYFAVDWEAVIELSNGGNVFKKVRVNYYTDDYANWERENLGGVKIALDGIPRSEPAASVTR